MATEQEVERLAEAMWQILDDMGRGGLSVCLLAKAEARAAMDPFLNDDRPECPTWMSLADAKGILSHQ